MITLEEIKQCTSYAEAIRLIFNKNYTNGKLQEKVQEWCLSNYNFDLERHLEEYKNRKVYCLQCGKEITGKDRFNKKFCSQSCAAKYSNSHRVRTKKEKKPKLKHKCTCVVCGSEFYSTHKHSTHCSVQCTAKDPNVKDKMREKVQERINNGTFSGWQSRNITSYPEQFWIKVLDDHNITYVREDFSTKKYFLDFLIEKNGKKIDLEIDGKQHKDRKDHDKERDEYLTNLGYIIYRIDWNSINNQKGKDLMKSKIEAFLEYYNSL